MVHTATPTTEGGFRPRQLIRSVYAPSLLYGIGSGMLLPAVPLYAHELDVPLGLIGLLASVQGMGAMLSDVPAGLLVARIGGRTAMTLSLLVSAAGALALGLSSGPIQLFLAVPLAGAGYAMWATCRLAHVADVALAEQRGRALAVTGGSSRIGLTLGPIIGGFLGERVGIEAAFFGHAAMALVSLVLVVSFARDREPRRAPGASHPPARVLQTVVEHRSALLRVGSVAVSLVVLRTARTVLIPLWGVAIGLDLFEIGLAIGLASALDMTLFYPVGAAMDRFGRKWTIVPCLVTLSASMAATPLTTDFVSFVAVGLLGGFGNGLGSGAVMTMGADLAPPERSGEFIGVWRLICDSGAVFSPALAGGLAQAFTLGAAFVGSASIGLGGALLLALGVREGLHGSASGARRERPARDP